jgi:hypothetical protein
MSEWNYMPKRVQRGVVHEFWYETDELSQAASVVGWMFTQWRAAHEDKWDYHLEQTINYEVDPQSGDLSELPQACYLVMSIHDEEIAAALREKFDIQF